MKNKDGLVIGTNDPESTSTAWCIEPRYSQQCLLCENTRDLPKGMHFCNTPWICDECKEAIVFVKDFMRSCNKAQAMLDEMKDHD